MMPAIDLHSVAQYSALRLLDSLAEGMLVGLFAAALLRLSRRQNAGTRFAILFSALVAIAVLPLMSAGWTHGGVSHAFSGEARLVLPETWALYLFLAWAVVAGWLLAGVSRALCHLRQLRRSCVPIDPKSLDPILRQTLLRQGSKRRVALCTSVQVRVPTAVGLLKPAIVFPQWAMRELSSAELKQVLLHELAHLRRWDDWSNLAQQVVRALFFFHPAVWWIERKVALEREMACDESVLSETGSPRAYAECLAHLAEKSFFHRGMALAQAVLGRASQISQRMAQILHVNQPQVGAQRWKLSASLVAGFALLCSVVTARSPKLIAFQADVRVAAAVTSPQQGAPELNAGATSAASSALQRPPRVSFPKLAEKPRQRQPEIHLQAASFRKNPKASSLARSVRPVHLTGLETAPPAITETLFFIVQSSGDNSERPLYQIQMWRVMVLHTVVDSTSSTPPRKET